MDAFDVLQYAMVKYSAHPLIISYYGWLDAAVEGSRLDLYCNGAGREVGENLASVPSRMR